MAYDGLMSQIANPQIADIAGALDYRQKRIAAEQERQREARMREIIGQAIPGLRKGSVLAEMAQLDPDRFIFMTKTLGVPMNDGEKLEQMSQDVRSLARISSRDPSGGIAFAESLAAEREALGLDASNMRKWVEVARQDPGKAIRAINMLDESLNADLINAERMQERKMKLQERELDIQEKRIDKDVKQGESSYYQPIQTANGLYAFNARTGKVEQALTPEGGTITPAQTDVALQGQLAGAKTGASEREKVKIDREKAVGLSEKLFAGIDEARKLLPVATGSALGAARDVVLGAGGIATEPSKAAAKLDTLAGWMVANVPRMEGPQSNIDVENYKTMAGRVGNRSLPVEERIAALDILESLQRKYASINSPTGATPGIAPASATQQGETAAQRLARLRGGN